MASAPLPQQPTIQQLLNSDSMSEAQILWGENLLQRPIFQVVTSLVPRPRPGSLLITRPMTLAQSEISALPDLAGIVVIKPYVVSAEPSVAGGQHAGAGGLASVSVDVELGVLVKLCADAGIPIVAIPGFGEPAQAAEDVRTAFLSEVKRGVARLYGSFVSSVLDQGLTGLLEDLAGYLNRPLAIETSDFKILAARNMGPTPPSHQRTLADEVAKISKRQLREQRTLEEPMQTVRIGRRLVMPIPMGGLIAGYFSVMLRPNDDAEYIREFLQPAALAAMVDFSHRQKGLSTFSATQKSLLKDLLSGRSLSAADQERLEQHFGFDLCDGFLVFAVQEATTTPGKTPSWPEQPFVSTEVEGTRIYVVPYHEKSGKTWQQEAEALVALIKKGNKDTKIQLGAGRLIQTTLDLPDSYREARQALILGSMMHGENEFVTGYGDLGVRRLLYLMIDHPELERFYEENLAPLEAYDAEWESELVPTLAVYLKEGANLNSAARALFIHRHTLRYRLEQIADILKVDIDSQEVLLNLQIAFLVKEMKGKRPL